MAVKLVDKKGNTFLLDIDRPTGKRMLKAHFNSYAFDVEAVPAPKNQNSGF
jgi:hypothetical protein